MEYLGQGPLAARIRALGLMRRINSFTTDVSPALDDLRHAIGAERLRRILIDLSAAGTTPYDIGGVACALDHSTGRPVAAWMNRYLAEGYPPLKSAGDCR